MVQRRKRKVVQIGRGECVGGRIVSQGCTVGRKGDRTCQNCLQFIIISSPCVSAQGCVCQYFCVIFVQSAYKVEALVSQYLP